MPSALPVATNVPYRLTRLGVLMSPEPGAEFEAGGAEIGARLGITRQAVQQRWEASP